MSEKNMTKYDRKMQRRSQGEEKDNTIKYLGIACVAFLAFCIGVFGFQTYKGYKEKTETYVTVGEHEVKKAEYDYYFYTSVNQMYASYGSYLSSMGLDLSKPLKDQMCPLAADMSWQDYFDEQAMMQLKQVYALSDDAQANDFEYDATDDVKEFETQMKSTAESYGYTTANYLKALYGSLASMKEVKTFVERDSYVAAYYNDVQDGIEVSDEEIETYYNDNKVSYDSVDYLVCKIEADIPETEVEEETEETAETLSEEEQAALESEQAAEAEAIKEEAMAVVEEKANEMLEKIESEESFKELSKEYATDQDAEIEKVNVRNSAVSPATASEWLFNDEREAGDTEVVKSDAENAYYVFYFQQKYLDETKTVDVRHILVPTEAETTEDMTDEEKTEAETKAKEEASAKAEEIYDAWKNGEATEDTFAEAANEHSTDPGSNTNGGLYEAVTKGQMVESFDAWIFDDARKPGDTSIVETDYGYHIMYFVGDNAAAWKMEIKDQLVSQKMSEFVETLTSAVEAVYVNPPETTAETVAETPSETVVETTVETDDTEETEK